MVETLELRVNEERFGEPFRANEGKMLGKWVRRVILSTDDVRMPKIAELQSYWNRHNSFLFAGWIYHRKYNHQELELAECLKLDITAVFEPAGEECGTVYDESRACPHPFPHGRTCGAGAKQISDLFLDLRKVPKAKDIASTIADEWIVSQRLAELLVDAKITGFELRPVRHRARFDEDPVKLESLVTGREILQRAEKSGLLKGSWAFDVWLNRVEQRELVERTWRENAERLQKREAVRRPNYPTWYQLVITSSPVPTAPPTRFGIDPFDEDPEGLYRCPCGHIAGLNLLSEVTLKRSGWDGSDFGCTKEMIGVRGGVGRPHPILLASPKLWRLLIDHSVRGFKLEVAHLI
jgi:hypothetical protein